MKSIPGRVLDDCYLNNTLTPMKMFQSLENSTTEFVVAANILKERFKDLSDERCIEILLELKRMGLPKEL